MALLLKVFKWLAQAYLFTAKVIGILILTLLCIWVSIQIAAAVQRFNDQIHFPNGMIIKRQISFSSDRWYYGRNALFTSDGRTELVRSVKSVCFDDRYINVSSYAYDGGTFDGKTNSRVKGSWQPASNMEVTREGGQGGPNCNGYFKTYLSAATLYEGKTRQHYPIPCEWRNLDNPDLKHREWFDRPCIERGDTVPIWKMPRPYDRGIQ